MSVVLYTKPACVQCNATHKQLDKLGVSYEVIDISEDDTARDYVMGLGYLQAPVVVDGDDHWSGFRPDKLKRLATRVAA
ncbi:glutaredoxin-like protein NrdH [Gordonia malaquae]|uniref:glutaredoxin-like protein NrdH n=1 Tax=Gordonia malaquae TaxID=410332 RepID=UPI003015AA31